MTDHLVTRLLEPARLTEILATLVGRRVATEESLNAGLASLQREVVDVDDKLKRLHKLVENGLTDRDDVLKDRLNALKAERDRARAALERGQSPMPAARSRSIRP